MSTQNSKKIILGLSRILRFILTGFLLFLSIPLSDALTASFTVTNVSEFQAALNAAATNSENDTINVMAGNYNVASTLTFLSTEESSILIKGHGSPVFNGGDSLQIMNLITTSNNGDIYLRGVIVEHGRTNYGGGLYVETHGGDILVDSCIVNDSRGDTICGGANLYSVTGNITVTNCIFRRNSSPNTSGYPYGTAGGLFVQTEQGGTEIRVTGCTFEENTAQRDGGGAMLYPLGSNALVIVEDNVCSNNVSSEFCEVAEKVGSCKTKALGGFPGKPTYPL